MMTKVTLLLQTRHVSNILLENICYFCDSIQSHHAMIRNLYLLFLIVLFSPVIHSFAQESCVVDSNRLQHYVYTLASDSMQGRASGMPGQKMAASFIEEEFRAAGLSPAGDSGFFQPFVLYSSTIGQMQFSGVRKVATTSARVPYGIAAPDTCQFVYPGKKGWRAARVLPGQSQFLLIRSGSTRKANKEISRYYALGFRHFLVVTESKRMEFQRMKLSLIGNTYRLTREPVSGWLDRMAEGADTATIAVIHPASISPVIGFTPDYQLLDQQIRKNRSPIVLGRSIPCFAKPGKLDSLMTENVAGMLGGEGSEVIVITAHYDHVGVGEKGINAGADDNASGTAALMELAHALSCMKQRGEKFEKSVVFVAFSAEELGLLGSQFFVESPVCDSLEVVLNVNMDMIGRSVKYGLIETFVLQAKGYEEDPARRESFVYLLNKGKGTRKMVKQSKSVAKTVPGGFAIDRSPGLMMRMTYKVSSDHANFTKKGIPIMVWFTGLHPDYHTPADTPDKIDYANLRRVTEVILQTTLQAIRP
jgi:hypothetical protein